MTEVKRGDGRLTSSRASLTAAMMDAASFTWQTLRPKTEIVIDVSRGLEQTSLHHLKTPLLLAQLMGGTMAFADRDIMCIDCGAEFVFSAGEQLFFHDKQFTHDPKRCKQCKKKHASGGPVRHETKTICSACGESTTVPFKITQGRPVLCRSCFVQGSLKN